MFNNRGSFALRLIGVLLLVALMIGGGVMVYRAGVANGIAQSPEVAAAISDAAESGGSLPMHGYGYSYPGYRMRPHFGFFPFGGILGLFLFFGLMRMIFFRPWAWHHYKHHGRGPWKKHGRHWGPPPWAYEDEVDEDEGDSEKKEE
jgi:hypothetical protein